MPITRFTNYSFKNGQVTKNRVVIPPMASQTADHKGFVTAKTIEHYRRLNQANAGIIFIEYSFIHQTGKGEPQQLGIDSDDKIEGLQKIASEIKQSGAIAGIQLVHVGGKTTSELTGYPLMGPSALQVPVKGRDLEIPTAMEEAQIQQWLEWFLAAANRAVMAGFDLVELHAAHGYGLNQWLSPLTNQRIDRYGKTLENRSRLLLQIVQTIKMQFPKILLSVRIPGQDHLSGGLSLEDMIGVVKQLEAKGVDLINVSSGIGGWRRPEGRTGEGYLVGDAAKIKSQTHVPVIGVGGIESGAYIDQILQTSQVDFAAVGRAILSDPEQWASLNLNAANLKVAPNIAIEF